MVSVSLGLSVDYDDYNEIRKKIKSAMRLYDFNKKDHQPRCTKAKALKFLIDLGFQEYERRIDDKFDELKAKKKQLEGEE